MSKAGSTAETLELDTGRTIGKAELEPGDIIATASDGRNSRAIQWTTNAPHSHAILYFGGGSAVDAMPGDGVTEDLLARKLRGVAVASVFRHRTATREQREMASKWAAMQADKPYNTLGAARLGIERGSNTYLLRFTRVGVLILTYEEQAARSTRGGRDASFFCTELIFRAYEIAGAPLVEVPAHLVSPGKLLRTESLRYVGNLDGYA
ncbi:MAG: hypothetical protein JJU06_12865 [Ectothiorhodospiraceae bacterium]|nr:hypothetical protein [Ectothiorhodospiraceae bacterium]